MLGEDTDWVYEQYEEAERKKDKKWGEVEKCVPEAPCEQTPCLL